MITISGLIYLVACYGVGRYAEEQRRSMWFWILVSLFISPIFAFIVLLILGKK